MQLFGGPGLWNLKPFLSEWHQVILAKIVTQPKTSTQQQKPLDTSGQSPFSEGVLLFKALIEPCKEQTLKAGRASSTARGRRPAPRPSGLLPVRSGAGCLLL